MKIAVCGKGGSGKSTIVAILVREFQRRDRQVLVLDSDESNSGLHWMIGIDEPPKPLIEHVGGKHKIQDKMSTGFTAESGATSLSLWREDEIAINDIPDALIKGSKNCQLVVAGKIGRIYEGCACPMGVVTREFLKKLQLGKNQIAIVDMEAGVEHFGRGIESSIDAVAVVVEPSLESLSIAEKTKELTESSSAHFAGAIINKLRPGDSQKRVTQELKFRGIPELGHIRYHEQFLDDGLSGRPVNLEVSGAEASAIADRLLDFISTHSP
jgi:CO dehydrogenase maturation factor